ncbi:MAG: MBL fold metallo-hydrolase [Chloroflexota bacterium]|nr:MBL fold metallo-hydrolase [Chloroflexota bacterium]
MVNVTFLGTGNAFSAGRRTNLSLMIEASQFRMVVEAGPMTMEQLGRAGLRPTDVEHLFVTHAHGDHVLGFPMLALNRLDATTPLHVYAGLNTIASLRILSTLAFSSLSTNRLNLRWHEISEEGPGETELPFGVRLHTALPDYPPGVPTLAARWNFPDGISVTTVTDTRPGPTSVELARESDLLIHEASFSAILEPDANPHEHYHSTARQAGEIAREAGCKRLALVHLGPEIGERPDVLIEEARAGTDLEVIVPEDGDRIRAVDW